MGVRIMFGDFSKALVQLGDRRFQSVLLKGLGLTIALLIAIYLAFVWIIGAFVPDTFSLPFIGQVTWIDDALSIGSFFLMIGLSVFLMVPVASAFTGIFLEEVSEAVEDRHYPGLPEVPRQSIVDIVVDSLSFLGVIIVANVIALVLYLVLNVAAPLIFWALNGFLLGREYFQMVAIRRLGREGAKAARKRHMPEIWLAGALMAIPLTIPVVNLLIPVLGAATFTHMFMRLEGDKLRQPAL
ncbi:EI24 domain-containing protein [Celeribacter halophilus]|uniref:EI24 domain-containing protein n=1 Tax=Celeribacter halophilus TaxID=576117 RepID=UPI0020917625|nr:EI24 domain-containing protein [Celeribacter halophilus]MDO6510915.1 EI24 domain-containing protein [Celeribacter halophilus]